MTTFQDRTSLSWSPHTYAPGAAHIDLVAHLVIKLTYSLIVMKELFSPAMALSIASAYRNPLGSGAGPVGDLRFSVMEIAKAGEIFLFNLSVGQVFPLL